MSLYNNVAKSLIASSGGAFGGVLSGIDRAIGAAGSSLAGSLGGGALVNTLTDSAASMASSYAREAAQRIMPTRLADAAFQAGGALASGDWNTAGLAVLRSGLLGDAFGSTMRSFLFGGTPSNLMGGLSRQEARKRIHALIDEQLARKNLWLLTVKSPIGGDFSERFNLFATNVEYSPFIVEGDKVRAGGAQVDLVEAAGATELSITTYDDADGSLKKWFAAHHAAAVAKDGTVAEPGKYAIRIGIKHHYLDDTKGYEDIGLFRPDNLQVSLSRLDDQVQELQMTFSQLDTFISP